MCDGRGWSAVCSAWTFDGCRPGGTPGLRTCLVGGQRRRLSHLRDSHRPLSVVLGRQRLWAARPGRQEEASPPHPGRHGYRLGRSRRRQRSHLRHPHRPHALVLGIEPRRATRDWQQQLEAHHSDRVGTGADWADVSAAGFAHTCAIRTDHTLWCWGFNSSGQLGLGDNTDRSTPTQVGIGTDWSHVTAGDSYTCATRADHTLWCWETTAAVNSGSATPLPGPPPPRSVPQPTGPT